MARIEQLTDAQWQSVYQYRDQMALAGYSTQPADRLAAGGGLSVGERSPLHD